MSKLIRNAQPAYQLAERAYQGYTNSIPNGSLSKNDFEDAFFQGLGSPKYNEVDAVVRREWLQVRVRDVPAYQAGISPGGETISFEPSTVSGTRPIQTPSSVSSQRGPVGVGPPSPIIKRPDASVLQTALNAFHNLAKGLPNWIDEYYSDAPKVRAILTDLIGPLRNYAFNSAPVKMTRLLDDDTKRQYDLVKRLKSELSAISPFSLWGEKARENVAVLNPNITKSIRNIKALQNATNEIMDEVSVPTVEAAGASINRAANNLQNVFSQFLNLSTIELEESEPEKKLTPKAERWAQWMARERVNAVIANKAGGSAATAAELRMSQNAIKAIKNEYNRIAQILKDPEKARNLIGSARDSEAERQAKIDHYKTTGRLATAHTDYSGLSKLANRYYKICSE